MHKGFFVIFVLMEINYLQIYDYELNISKALNKAIEKLNDWICLTDQDTLKFPSFPNNLKEILLKANKNDLIGATTNRLNPVNPQTVKELFNEPNINTHFNYSIEAWNKYGTELEKTKLIAGCCMIFHKELWQKVGGFQEDKIFFDKYFSYDVTNNGGKCLIAKGLYIFHLYRWKSKDPTSAVEHLIKN